MTSTKKATENEQPFSSNTSSSGESLLFQAVGVISGEVDLDEENNYTTITIQKKKYPLRCVSSPKARRAFDALKNQIQNTQNNHQRLKVYPRVSTTTEAPESMRVEFGLVSFDRGNSSGLLCDLNPLEFKLAGLWESVSFFKLPCVCVLRNFNHGQLQFLNQMKVYQKVKFMKPSYIPLFWKDALVEPFRFDPSIPREEQGKPYFITLKAKFSVHKNIFVFDSLLSLPSLEPPRFFKPTREMKERASKTRNFGLDKNFELLNPEKITLALPAAQEQS